jgi:hypothetical protein
MVFQLPLAASKSFKPMLEGMDERMAALGVETYGLSVTTLEEVFIKVAKDEHNQDDSRDAHVEPTGFFPIEAAARAAGVGRTWSCDGGH